MNLQLRKGMFLVAAPGLRDPNFRQAVVLLCEHGTEGALGVIVNRPTAMSISRRIAATTLVARIRPLRSSTAPTTVPSVKATLAGPSHGSITDAWNR